MFARVCVCVFARVCVCVCACVCVCMCGVSLLFKCTLILLFIMSFLQFLRVNVVLCDQFNTFPALIKSKNSVSFDYFCSTFISRRWSAVILYHSTLPEPTLKELQDGGGLVA